MQMRYQAAPRPEAANLTDLADQKETRLKAFALLSVASAAEVARVAALAREIWTEHYTPLIGSGQVEYMLATIQSADSIVQQMREGLEYQLLLANDEDAGYFAVRPDLPSQTLFLSKLYVRREMRGRALATRALEWMGGRARQLGLRAIRLTVNKRNCAVQVYLRMGFEVKEDVVTPIGEGYVMDDYLMEKSLA
jgi:diamine N-acetyltransferase